MMCFKYNEAIFTNIRAKKNIVQNLVNIRKGPLPKNKTTFFTYFLNGTLVSKKAPFKKCMKKSCRYIF